MLVDILKYGIEVLNGDLTNQHKLIELMHHYLDNPTNKPLEPIVKNQQKVLYRMGIILDNIQHSIDKEKDQKQKKVHQKAYKIVMSFILQFSGYNLRTYKLKPKRERLYQLSSKQYKSMIDYIRQYASKGDFDFDLRSKVFDIDGFVEFCPQFGQMKVIRDVPNAFKVNDVSGYAFGRKVVEGKPSNKRVSH